MRTIPNIVAVSLLAVSSATAQDRYPFEGRWDSLEGACKGSVNLQHVFKHDRILWDGAIADGSGSAGQCLFRSVKKQRAGYTIDLACEEGDSAFHSTAKIAVNGDSMTLSRTVPWQKKQVSVTFMRCDEPQAATATAKKPATAAKASGALPQPVAAWVKEVADGCRLDGGRPASSPNHVRAADVNGDGKPDYLVDDNLYQCQGATVQSCGSHGCSVEAFLSGSKGYRAAGLDLLAYGSEIQPGGKLSTLVIETRGGTFRFAWNGKSLAKR